MLLRSGLSANVKVRILHTLFLLEAFEDPKILRLVQGFMERLAKGTQSDKTSAELLGRSLIGQTEDELSQETSFGRK